MTTTKTRLAGRGTGMVGDPRRGEERQKVGVSVQHQSTATTELFSAWPSSRCVLTSANKAPNGYCAEFGTKRSSFEGPMFTRAWGLSQRDGSYANRPTGQSSGALSSRDSVEGVQVLSVGVGQRVKVLLGRLDLVVTHPVHY